MYLRYSRYNVTTKETTHFGIRMSDIVDYQWIASSDDSKRHEITIFVKGDTRPRYFKGETALSMYEQLRDC
jgi:hypothetical protein